MPSRCLAQAWYPSAAAVPWPGREIIIVRGEVVLIQSAGVPYTKLVFPSALVTVCGLVRVLVKIVVGVVVAVVVVGVRCSGAEVVFTVVSGVDDDSVDGTVAGCMTEMVGCKYRYAKNIPQQVTIPPQKSNTYFIY